MADASVMNCHDVRQGFTAPSRGGMGLTERAIVHAHVAQCADCRRERESLQLLASSPQLVQPSRGPSSFAPLTRLRVLLSLSLARSAQAAGRAVEAARAVTERAIGLLAWVGSLLPTALARSARAAASLSGLARLGITRLADRLLWVRSSLMIAWLGVMRAAIRGAGAGLNGVLAQMTRLRALISASGAVPVAAAGRLTAASRAGATQTLDVLMRAIAATRDAGQIVMTTFGRVLSDLGARLSALPPRTAAAWTRTRPLLRVCTGIVGLAVLVAATVSLWSPQWPHNLVFREPALARTSAPAPVAAPAPAPVEVSRPETPRVVPRPRLSGAPAEIPAPVRRSDPAVVQSRAAASAPTPPTEATQNAEASDPTAAIDWLLKGGSGRRQPQSP